MPKTLLKVNSNFGFVKASVYLRNEAAPELIFNRDILEYWALARALCAAAVSTADTLRNPAT